MTEPVWLPLQTIIDLQSEQLARFGGPDGIRDSGLLESALARPVNRWHYGETDLAPLAASYAFGLARNHPFVDGNKRIAFQAMMTFLRLNDIAFAPEPRPCNCHHPRPRRRRGQRGKPGAMDQGQLAQSVRPIKPGKPEERTTTGQTLNRAKNLRPLIVRMYKDS